MMRAKTTFLQPRHIYAENDGLGHVHMSAPMITAMAQLHAAGATDIEYRDENFPQTKEIDADIIGINLVGAPYIPKVIEIIKDLRSGVTVLLGGQIIDSLGKDFDRLFSLRDDVRVVNGNRAEVQKEIFEVLELPEAEAVSSIPIWEKIDEQQMKEYLSREFSFYLSQGCKHACTFCQAKKARPEKYRNIEIALRDMEWLTKKALSFGLDKLSFYLSNLDLFQTPAQLKEFAEGLIELRDRYGLQYEFRGLVTVDSTLEIDDECLEICKEAGLKAVGLGIDGATPAVWKKTAKVHNLSSKDQAEGQKCIDAVKRVFEAQFTPEILMVFGHDTGDLNESEEDLIQAMQFTEDMMRLYGAIPRPHVVKDLVPGSKEWKRRKANGDRIEMLLKNPELFQALDYTALPSEISHPDPEFRALVAAYYFRICALSEHGTKPVFPNTEMTRKLVRAVFDKSVEEMNLGKFDR